MNAENKDKWLKRLTFAGCYATGIIYGSIGVIAMLSFLQLKDGGADESSFMALLDEFFFGKVLNILIIAGALSFVVWRFYEAAKDPYKLGSDLKGITLRTGAVFSSVADAFIAFSALQALTGKKDTPSDGSPVQQRQLTATVMENSWGDTLIFALGIIMGLTALVLVFYGVSRRFAERINLKKMSTFWAHSALVLAYVGYVSRGIILGIMAFFFMKAAHTGNADHVVNTDKAFDFIGDHVGHPFFIAVALGTLCYGLYMFILGVRYDTDEDK